jgi:transcriptional regulator with XRE-family HTH domain
MTRKPISEDDREHGVRLGRLIADQRKLRDWSAPELARSSGVSIDAVRSLENGRVPMPSFRTIARLAESLQLSLDELQLRASQRREAHETNGGQR